jgi:hypothetical protein
MSIMARLIAARAQFETREGRRPTQALLSIEDPTEIRRSDKARGIDVP